MLCCLLGRLGMVDMVKIVGIEVQKLVHKSLDVVHDADLLSLIFTRDRIAENEGDYLPNLRGNWTFFVWGKEDEAVAKPNPWGLVNVCMECIGQFTQHY